MPSLTPRQVSKALQVGEPVRAVELRASLGGFWATSLGTLASRVLGLFRDLATASLLGLSAGGVMDAFVLALRLPNLARRLLGEGALATSYLPVLTAELDRDRQAAARLASAVLAGLAFVLTLLVAGGELVCGAAYLFAEAPSVRLLAGLSAALLPYLWFVCLAAQLATTLQALGRFGAAAVAGGLLNVVWLAAAWWIAPHAAGGPLGRAYLLSGAVVLAGLLQVLLLVLALRRAGFHWQRDLMSSRAACRQILVRLGPIALALSITQLSTLMDSLLAWLLTAPVGAGRQIGWLPFTVDYPLESGATAALYFAERFYQFPVGLLGVALATVLYPTLSRHAARGDRLRLAGDLAAALRFCFALALPAGVGLILFAQPLTVLCLEHGAFTAADVPRCAGALAGYSAGVWAYCAIPLATRGFYALGDAREPLRIGAVALALNAILDLALVWPYGEAGLAWATSVSSAVQVSLLVVCFARRHATLSAAGCVRSIAISATATLLMSLTVLGCRGLLPTPTAAGERLLQLGLLLSTGVVSYLLAARLLGDRELGQLLPRFRRSKLPARPTECRA